MVTLEQVKLLETKVIKAIGFVNQVTAENTLLKGKLDTYQRRIDELEVLVQRFKEDQSSIEDGILSALDRLNQFEDAVEKSISSVSPGTAKIPAAPERSGTAPMLETAETGPALPSPGFAVPEEPVPEEEEPGDETDPADSGSDESSELDLF
jgi:hypothetical protein